MASAKPVSLALLGAGARGELNLASLARKHPEALKFVAVAEPHEGRRERFIRQYGIKRENAFADWREIVTRPALADAVINTLPCRMHYDSAMAMMDAGYPMLLEKPMALEPWQCMRLIETARTKGLMLAVAVQNRYNRIYQRTKALLERGTIGRLINLDCAENIGYWHFIMSYVRGIHHHHSLSHSFMMAKGIHDIDLILWLAGKKVKRVSSFGSLSFFNADNAPPGAPERCMAGCPVGESCVFNAVRQHLKPGRPDIPLRLCTGQSLDVFMDLIKNPRLRSLGSIVSPEDISEKGILDALEKTDYGKCVFRSDNDVVDHQTVSLEFEDGATCSYSLSGFSVAWERTLNLHGSEGEIRTADFSGRLETRTFNPAKVCRERIPYHGILHGGGDKVILLDFAKAIQRGSSEGLLIAAETSLEPHLVVFAIEKARVEGKVVEMDAFRRQAANVPAGTVNG
ncbi:MAG TPA: Gfo/Idh/MocA family oxidoreductase [Candidatus Hydrogenedentes bacterium]|nr:Gfo/Idh/MocA family oxidoreductase [Candidatus Hydrogenedentota bacterium]